MNNIETSLQQLVDGELAHDDRIRLIERLEASPALWRQLGLAFVESQLLNETLNSPGGDLEFNDPLPQRTNSQRHTGHPNERASRISVIAWLTAMAASLLLGVFVGSSSVLNNRSIAVQSPPKNNMTASTVDHSEFADAIARSATPIPSHFRRELLKAGFQVDELEKMKTVLSPVGGSVDIPIREVEIRYVGNSIYQ